MKITRIEPKTLSKGPLVQLLVTVTTEDGASGTGECWWGVPDAKRPVSPYVATLEDVIAPRFIGQDATRIEDLWQEVTTWAYRYGDEGILSGALSGIDLALWDLKGRVLGSSVLDLLGGPVVSSLSAYASLPPLRALLSSR